VCDVISLLVVEVTSTPAYRLMPDGELEGKGPLKVKVLSNEIKLAL